MNNALRIIFTSVSLILLFVLQSCVGCSNSGKAKIIAKAKAEASKNQTVPEPNTMTKDAVPEIVEIEDIVTPKEGKSIKKELIESKIPPPIGNLIQVEGLVLKEVRELTIKLKTSQSQVEQILKMQYYIYSNWHYIFDPDIGRDTWRSAEATLSLKYQGKYSGDCDDFAILMASIARQVGLKSRMVGGFDKGDGHAFAEFLVPIDGLSESQLNRLDYRKDYNGIWVSLDWFRGSEHNRFTHDIHIFEDI